MSEVLRRFKYLIRENPLTKELEAAVKAKDTATAQKMQAERRVRDLTVTVGELQVARGKLSDELGAEMEKRREAVSALETDKLRWGREKGELEDKLGRAEAALKKAHEDYIAVDQERIRAEGKGRLEGVEAFKSSDEGKAWRAEGVEAWKDSEEAVMWAEGLMAEPFGQAVGEIVEWVNRKNLEDFSWTGCPYYVEPESSGGVLGAGSDTDLSSLPSDDVPLASLYPLDVKPISSVPWAGNGGKGASSSSGPVESGERPIGGAGPGEGLEDPGELPPSFADLMREGGEDAPITIEGDLFPPAP